MVCDIVVIVIIALSTFLGYRKGFVSLAIKLVTLVIAVVLTFVLYNPVTNFLITNTQIDETIENAIYENAIKTINNSNKNPEQNNNYTESIKEQMVNGILPQTVKTLSINIFRLGVIILLFIAIKLILRCIKSLTNLVAKLPIIKQGNKIGGIVYGLIRGLLLIFAVLSIIEIVTTVNTKNYIYQQVQESYITKSMYENNPITIFFK